MARKYHTVVEYDRTENAWFDGFGSYSLKEANEEAASLKDYWKRVKVLTHDDTGAAMINAVAELNKKG